MRICVSLDETTAKVLNDYCNKTGATTSRIISKLINDNLTAGTSKPIDRPIVPKTELRAVVDNPSDTIKLCKHGSMLGLCKHGCK